MNLFGTGAAGVLGSGSTPWLLISLGLGLVVLGMWYRKKIFPRRFGAGDGQRPRRILPGFPRRDDLRGKDRVAGRGVIPFRARATLQPRLSDDEKEKTLNEEESAMRTPERTTRKVTHLLLALTISAALAACGGGGGGSATSPGTSGPVPVNVTLGGTDVAPPVSEIPVNLLAPAILAPADAAVPAMKPSRESFEHVYVYMTGVAFIPVETMPASDLRPPLDDGEVLYEGPEVDFRPKFVVHTFPRPVGFDLLNPPTGREIAKFLNRIEVPAGVYHKIRVYYQKVVVRAGVDEAVAHRTANGHLDIHFKAAGSWDADDVHVDDRGYLVIPVAPNPADGVRLYCVAIEVTGLKVHETGSGKIIVRPQVFAKLTRPVQYSITGRADNVVHATSSFDIRSVDIETLEPLATLFPTVYHPLTRWAFDNDVFSTDGWEVALDDSAIGIAALRNGAYVEAIGVFKTAVTPLTFRADKVFITFPDVKDGVVDNTWRADDTFVLRLTSDNVVFPMPGKGTAYYDNLANPAQQLDNTFIDNNVPVKARGYAVAATPTTPGGIEAYWISIGP